MTSEGQLILRIDREYPTDIAELKWEMIPYIPADFTHDGSVNVADLHIFASHWLMRDCENFMYRCEELDRDSYINLDDFSIFARYWPQGVN
jgi:hypothetical protein